MNKTELIQEVASATQTKKDAGASVNAALGALKSALARGERITLIGLGTFTVKTAAARKGRHPRTGASLVIPSRRAVRFKPSAGLVDAVNGEAASAPSPKKPWRFNDANARWRV